LLKGERNLDKLPIVDSDNFFLNDGFLMYLDKERVTIPIQKTIYGYTFNGKIVTDDKLRERIKDAYTQFIDYKLSLFEG